MCGYIYITHHPLKVCATHPNFESIDWRIHQLNCKKKLLVKPSKRWKLLVALIAIYCQMTWQDYETNRISKELNVWKDFFWDDFGHQGDWEQGCVNGHDVVTLERDILEHVMFSKCRDESS